MQAEPRNTFDRAADTLLRIDDVRRRTGLSTATIYRREAAGTFPRRVRVSAKCVRWYEADIGQFICDPCGYRAPS